VQPQAGNGRLRKEIATPKAEDLALLDFFDCFARAISLFTQYGMVEMVNTLRRLRWLLFKGKPKGKSFDWTFVPRLLIWFKTVNSDRVLKAKGPLSKSS
jgi:hypothetical protein